jgi:hypothetical protein
MNKDLILIILILAVIILVYLFSPLIILGLLYYGSNPL